MLGKNEYKVMCFLQSHPTEYFSVKQISNHINVPSMTLGSTICLLKKKDKYLDIGTTNGIKGNLYVYKIKEGVTFE